MEEEKQPKEPKKLRLGKPMFPGTGLLDGIATYYNVSTLPVRLLFLLAYVFYPWTMLFAYWIFAIYLKVKEANADGDV